MASERDSPADDVAAFADELGAPGGSPRPLDGPFSLGPPLDEMAGHPELGAAHQGWVALAAGAGPEPSRRGRQALARLVLGALRHHPEYRQQRELLAQLTRVVDALAKRCDELDRRLRLVHDELGEIAAVLSEDVTRLAALAASPEVPARSGDA